MDIVTISPIPVVCLKVVLKIPSKQYYTFFPSGMLPHTLAQHSAMCVANRSALLALHTLSPASYASSKPTRDARHELHHHANGVP